jgi:hypothetical protein
MPREGIAACISFGCTGQVNRGRWVLLEIGDQAKPRCILEEHDMNLGDNELVARIERLEKQNRWQKKISVLLSICICAFLLMAQASRNEVVRASRFDVIDSEGRTRMQLGVDDRTGPSLILLDEAGSLRAAMSTLGGSLLMLYDRTGKVRAQISATDDSAGITIIGKGMSGGTIISEDRLGPALILTDETGKGRATINLKGTPNLSLLDVNGKAQLAASLTASGPVLRLGSQAELNVNEGAPGLFLFDASNQFRVGLIPHGLGVFSPAGRIAVGSDGGPHVSIFDESGQTRAGLLLSKEGPRLSLQTGDGSVLFSKP